MEGCNHEVQELRKRRYGGNEHFAMQCLTCGVQVRPVKKHDAIWHEGDINDWDADLTKNYWDRRFEERKAERERNSQLWWDRYNEYMNSDQWRERRDYRLRLDRYQCQARMRGCLIRATQVHHRNYKNFGNEPLFDLVSVCRVCHESIHDEAEREGTAA